MPHEEDVEGSTPPRPLRTVEITPARYRHIWAAGVSVLNYWLGSQVESQRGRTSADDNGRSRTPTDGSLPPCKQDVVGSIPISSTENARFLTTAVLGAL
jgi:hypothetical protein